MANSSESSSTSTTTSTSLLDLMSPPDSLLLRQPCIAGDQEIICRLMTTSRLIRNAVLLGSTGTLTVDFKQRIIRHCMKAADGASMESTNASRRQQAAWLMKHSQLICNLNMHEVAWTGDNTAAPGEPWNTEYRQFGTRWGLYYSTCTTSACDWFNASVTFASSYLEVPPAVLAGMTQLVSLSIDLSFPSEAACKQYLSAFLPALQQLKSLDLRLNKVVYDEEMEGCSRFDLSTSGLQLLPQSLQSLGLAAQLRTHCDYDIDVRFEVQLPPGLLGHLTALTELRTGSFLLVGAPAGEPPTRLHAAVAEMNAGEPAAAATLDTAAGPTGSAPGPQTATEGDAVGHQALQRTAQQLLPPNLNVLLVASDFIAEEHHDTDPEPQPSGLSCLLQLQQLQLLDVSKMEMPSEQLAQLTALTSLTEVRVLYRGMSSEAAARAAWCSLPVKQLVLEKGVSADTLLQLPQLSGLTHLTVKGVLPVSQSQLGDVLMQLTKLQVLRLGSCACDSWQKLQFRPSSQTTAMMTNLDDPSMRQLAAAGYQSVAGATSASEGQREEEGDTASAGEIETHALLHAVCSLPQLQQLHLAIDWPGNSAARFAAVMAECGMSHRLTSLKFTGSDMLTDDDVKIMVACLAAGRLKQLAVYPPNGRCSNLTDAVVPVLAQLVPPLETLQLDATGVTWKGLADEPKFRALGASLWAVKMSPTLAQLLTSPPLGQLLTS